MVSSVALQSSSRRFSHSVAILLSTRRTASLGGRPRRLWTFSDRMRTNGRGLSMANDSGVRLQASPMNAPVFQRYSLENIWQQQKNFFREQHLSDVNNGLETYQFSVQSGVRACLEANLDRAFRSGTGARARAGSALSKPSLRCAGGSSRANCTCCCLRSLKITSATSA